MAEISRQDLRRQALYPFSDLPLPRGWKRVNGDFVTVCFHTYPVAPVVEPSSLRLEDVDQATEESHEIAREEGAESLVWRIAPADDRLGLALEQRGICNQLSLGFDLVEHSMVLTEPPAVPKSLGVSVHTVESIDDLAASDRVTLRAFELGAEAEAQMERDREERFAEYVAPLNPARQFIASVDGGAVVGSAAAVIGQHGVNLFAAGVVPEARGQGVYRALIEARWELACDLGTPALTVQAGRQSRPVLEALGFASVGAVKLYADEFPVLRPATHP